MKEPQKIPFSFESKIISGFFVLLIAWWATIQLRGLVDTMESFYYGLALGILPVLGGIFGLISARRWGGFSSSVGGGVAFMSLGLLTWGIGTLIFAYYNIFLDVLVPYPSLADAAYIISWPLWALGMLNLSQATGVKYQLRSLGGKFTAILLAAIAIAVSSYLMFVVATGGVGLEVDSANVSQTFFDFAYPIGDIVILTLAAVVFGLSFKYLGGRFKWPVVVILVGFAINFLADFSFSYTTTANTFFVANWVDLLFTCAMFALSLGMSMFKPSIGEKISREDGQ